MIFDAVGGKELFKIDNGHVSSKEEIQDYIQEWLEGFKPAEEEQPALLNAPGNHHQLNSVIGEPLLTHPESDDGEEDHLRVFHRPARKAHNRSK